jgi:hypothetical protein
MLFADQCEGVAVFASISPSKTPTPSGGELSGDDQTLSVVLGKK